MALSRVPIVPQWNLKGGCICTPDGGFLYVGAKSINYIGRVNKGVLPVMKVFPTRQAIISVDVDPGWDFNNTPKYFAVLAQDASVQIWDFEKGAAVSGHKAHCNTVHYMEGNGPSPVQCDQVLLSYMHNRNVLSVDARDIVVYCVASNTFCRRPLFVSTRNKRLTILRCSPYNENIFALGTSRGLVLICDLQQMSIIYTLRGHNTSISALSWNIVDTPETKHNFSPVANHQNSVKHGAAVVCDGDDIFDIYDYDYLENEFGAPSNAVKNKFDTFTGVVDEEAAKEYASCTKLDFVEACKSLKEDIDALKEDAPSPHCDVTLADCQQAVTRGDVTPPCGNDNISEGSLEFIERSSSDGDDNIDGTGRRILHQVEVHAPQSQSADYKEADVGTEQAPTLLNEEEIKHAELNSVTDHGDILLASASIDGTFWIWNTQTGGSCDNLKARGGSQQGKNTHFEIGWMNSSKLLTNNKQGDLTCWALQPQDTKNANKTSYKFKEEKQRFEERGVVSFNISKKDGLLWCISSYRYISCVNLMEEGQIAKYFCASTNISAMRECPDDMNKIALGFSDRRIGIIDISKMSLTNVFIENFVLRNDSPVMAIAWSPDKKKLAYGTTEGRVGIVNIENPRSQIFTFNSVCGKPIYSIDWHSNQIYVVCNNKLAVYNDCMTIKDAYIIRNIEGVSTVSVNDNYIYVGTQNGHLQVYRHKLQTNVVCELIQDIVLAPRYITDIAANPIVSDQVAVVANANTIHVLSFNSDDGSLKDQLKIEIKNARAANASVKWSTRNGTEFLTCGFDGAIRVWGTDSDDEKFLKQFHCPMTCGLFLPSDENIVVCAGKTTSLEFFDMRVEKSEDYSVEKWQRSTAHTLVSVKWAMEILAPTSRLSTAPKKRCNRRADVEVGLEKATVGHGNDTVNNTEIAHMINDLKIEDTQKQLQKSAQDDVTGFMKSPTTLLYLTAKEINKDVLEHFNFILNDTDFNKSTKSLLCAKLFGTKSDAKELLAIELINHQKSETKGISSIFMQQLNSNIKEEILKCIQNKQLKDWHLAIAPSISFNFWQKCCLAFADQLTEQGCALQAASYMLALHDYYKAIQMLLEKNYFKEALLIARIYLQPDDPLFDSIVNKWISYMDLTGNLSAAALLCALSGQMKRAYEILSKIRTMTTELENVLHLLQTHKKFR